MAWDDWGKIVQSTEYEKYSRIKKNQPFTDGYFKGIQVYMVISYNFVNMVHH